MSAVTDKPRGRVDQRGQSRHVRRFVLVAAAFGAMPALGSTPEVVSVPGGSFTLGNDAPRQGPPTPVEQAGFAITPREITVGQFRDFVEASGHVAPTGCFDWTGGSFQDDPEGRWDDPTSAPGDDYPVVCVRDEDATAYADWLSRETGAIWRLPTEAEWEYAAKAGNPASQPLVSETACASANLHDAAAVAAGGPGLAPLPCDDGFAKTAPVGGRAPNGFGLHDTLGNVSEWTGSCWRERHDAEAEDCGRHVVRGGAWKDDLLQASTTSRVGLPEGFRSRYFGFRLVKE